MAERENRKDLIIKTAGALFARYGYSATSTRQIASEVGCTEAALYYHFKDGKHGLLNAVMEARMPEAQSVIAACREARTLTEALLVFASAIVVQSSGMRWIIAELPQLTEEERTVVLENFSALRAGLAQVIMQYMDDDHQADNLAWIMVCVGAGYHQLFAEHAFRDRVDLPAEELIQTFIALIG